MLIFDKINDLRKFLSAQKETGKTIGFVPTMGALHRGHISLIARAKKENNIVVSSIFVNPTQFNDKKDLEKYPRPIEKDTLMLEQAGCDVLFAPSVEEMYPLGGTGDRGQGAGDVNNTRFPFQDIESRLLDLGVLDRVMEGAQRPGHFKGVVTVVSKLFDIVEPHKAYFGQKDFQQLAIIKEMVRQWNYPVKIVPCEIIREEDGLAMSSRNVRLSPEQRKTAAIIPTTLFKVQDLSANHSVEEIKSFVEKTFSKEPMLHLEYFEIINSETLVSIKSWGDAHSVTGCIAVKNGDVRLIDNVRLK